jgi:hypothetical protein
MTTYQDPPLQSRRASRQGERPEAQPSSSFAPPQVPRTAAGAGEPLSYVTQNRPPLPGYDTPPTRGRRASEPVPHSSAAPEEPQAQQFRPRDFSPEARTAPPAWAPEDDRDSGVLDHHTQARAAVVPPPAGSLAASLASEPSDQTLSRRELRAIRDAAGITAAPDTTPVLAQQAPAAPAPVPPSAFVPVPQQAPVEQAPVEQSPAAFAPPAAPPLVEPAAQQYAAPAPAPSTQLDSAMAEFDALAARRETSGRTEIPEELRRAGRRAAPQREATPEQGPGVVDSAFAPAPAAPAPAPQAAPAADQYPVLLPPEPAPMPPAQFQPPVVAPAAPAPVSTPTTGERPIGHWTNQSDLDDAVQVSESTISRTVGSAAITTSALVLPSIPGHDMNTGEVMLTGSISLPSALAATGAHHSIDESDIDHLLDPGDHQLVNTDSVPIRAIRAVSSHTATGGVIGSTQPKKAGRALTVLIAAASAMVVVVVTLLIVALATEVI